MAMNSVDLTTIYSAQAALQAPTLSDPKYGWFTYSLATLTHALLKPEPLFVLAPPTSHERGNTPVGNARDLTHPNAQELTHP